MEERVKTIKEKSIIFKNSGEIFRVEVEMKNISPETNSKVIKPFIDQLYQDVIKSIFEK